MRHCSSIKDGYLCIFGGEVSEYEVANDFWMLSFSSPQNPGEINLSKGNVFCTKIDQEALEWIPKPGSPCVRIESGLFYIARSITDMVLPIRSYLCCKQITGSKKLFVRRLEVLKIFY